MATDSGLETQSDFKKRPQEAEWWVCWNGDPKGPLSFKQVRQWLKEGKITRDSFIKSGCNEKWVPAGKAGIVPDLDEVFREISTATLWLLVAYTFIASIFYPHFVPWCLGVIAVYCYSWLNIFGLPKPLAKLVQWIKYHFF